MKGEIIKKLTEYHKQQGVAFLSEQDAEDYFRGLVTLIEFYYQKGCIDSIKPNMIIL